MTDLRLWRIRFDDDANVSYKYWRQEKGTPGAFDGEWSGSSECWTIFRTLEIEACPWMTRKGKGLKGGGLNWRWEHFATIIPLYDGPVKRKPRVKKVHIVNILTGDGKDE